MPKILQRYLFEDFKEIDKNHFFDSDIIVLYTDYQYPLDNKRWLELLSLLPEDLKNEVTRYLKWEDQHNALFGKLMVYFSYAVLNGELLNFERFCRDENLKPFIDNSQLCFNISHCGTTVVCAISKKNIKLGIDIEVVNRIDASEFESIFHQNELNMLTQANDPDCFYKFWTRKEACTKAIGTGITIPLNSIDTSRDIVLMDNAIFKFESNKFNNLYYSVAHNNKSNRISWKEIAF